MIVIDGVRLRILPGYVGRRLAVLFAFDLAIAVAYVFGGWKWVALPAIPLSIFGGAIGVIAGFRNTSAYARWWEARIVWGSIVNSSRSFAREVLSMIGIPDTGQVTEFEVANIRRKLVLLQVAYVTALRNQLRGAAPWRDLSGLLSEEELEPLKTQSNVSLAIQQSMAALLAQCHQLGCIDTMRWVSLDNTLSTLMDCQGASERLKNTPLPQLYDAFIRLFINVYCLLLPLAMVQSLGLLTPIGSTFVGFVFLALDQIGRDLETPFENAPHDIPLTAISRTVEINLKQMIGEKEVPEPLKPVDGVLW
jgi:ion channel-forming bestrophin family protein